MDTTCIYQMCSLLFIEIVQVWDMLEIVCIKITAFYYQVRLYIIVKYSYFKVPAFFFKDWFCFFKDFCMWCSGCCYFNGSFFCISAYQNAVCY